MSWIQIKKAIGIKVMVVKLHYSLFYGDRARTLVAQICTSSHWLPSLLLQKAKMNVKHTRSMEGLGGLLYH